MVRVSGWLRKYLMIGRVSGLSNPKLHRRSIHGTDGSRQSDEER